MKLSLTQFDSFSEFIFVLWKWMLVFDVNAVKYIKTCHKQTKL